MRRSDDVAEVEGVSVDTRHWIDGKRVESTQTFDDISPIDETVIATVHAGGQQEVDAAVAAAQAAFPAWAGLSARRAGGGAAGGSRWRRQAGRGFIPGGNP